MTDNSPKTSELSGRRDLRTGLSVEDMKQAFLDNLFYALNRTQGIATKNDLYTALALTVRDRVFHRSIHTLEQYGESKPRIVAYLSAEFLPGPHLGHNLLALGIAKQTRQALSELGYDLDELLEQEEEPGLGNGGLGRLASCFLDSLASLAVPAIGYGIRYEFGIFDQ
ncbi:MAG: glycogen/starch/alpha-glucan phosphorylase, partial [Chthoniobacterales bacterium]